jgi:hypothetical protein
MMRTNAHNDVGLTISDGSRLMRSTHFCMLICFSIVPGHDVSYVIPSIGNAQIRKEGTNNKMSISD